MATDGKKKTDSRDPSATKRKVRSAKGAVTTEPEAKGAKREVAKQKRAAEEGPGGLLVPGADLIGPGAQLAPAGGGGAAASGGGGGEEDGSPTDLGATKYVHAAFFAAAILVTYLGGKTLGLVWGRLADWPAAVEAVPQLLSVNEAQRGNLTMLMGVLVGVLTVVLTYRRADIRKWADEVALELSRVTWPDREAVTNGTIVVVVGSAVATVYITLLDRVWVFVTSLIYG